MKPFYSFLLNAALVACAPVSTTISDSERERIERDVGAAVEGFADAQRRRDVDAVLDFFASDFYMYLDGTRVDHDAVVGQIRSTMPGLKRLETTWSDIEVTALGADHALATFRFRDDVTDGQGVTTRLRGPTSLVWRLEAGEWRILFADADHYPVGK